MASETYDRKKQAIEKRRQDRIDTANANCDRIINNTKNSSDSPWDGLKTGLMLTFGTWVGWGVMFVVLAFTAGNFGFVGVGMFSFLFILWCVICTVIGICSYNRKENNINKIKGKAYEERRRAADAAKQNYEKEIRQLDTWYKDYQENVRNWAQKYYSGTEVPKLAGKLSDRFEQMIAVLRADPTVKMTEVDFDYTVEKGQIPYLSSYVIDFEQERLNELQSDMQCEALAQALAHRIKENVMAKYPQGQLKVSHNDAKVLLHYTGINPNHVPKRNI